MSHTPGPWHVLPRNPLCIEAADGNVGLVNLARASEADARLIAAAPELLAGLTRLIGTPKFWDNLHHDPSCKCVIHEARAAVCKAMGVES